MLNGNSRQRFLLNAIALIASCGLWGACANAEGDCGYTKSCVHGGQAGDVVAAGGTSGGETAAQGGTLNQGGFAPSSGGTSSEGGAGATAAGAGGEPTCGAACTGKTPVCDVQSMTCVGCLEATDCGGTTPACDPTTHSCVGCLAPADCRGSTPVCDPATHSCVACIAKADCGGTTPFCDVSHRTCVGCLEQADCTTAIAPRCDVSTHTCKSCTNSTQCSGIEGKPLCSGGECVECANQSDCKDATASQCDATTHTCKACTTDAHCSEIAGKGVCLAGACVQCTAAKAGACGTDTQSGTPYVCDSLKHTCTTQKAKSAGLCDACVSDAQCAAGELCVLDTLGSGTAAKSVGYFCHWKQGDTANGAPADCTTGSGPPYVKVLKEATSIDGSVADMCVLAVSTCIANAQWRKKDCASNASPDDSLCGFSPPKDAKCAQFGTTTFRCTMTCLSDDDCPGGVSCLTNVSPRVCAL